MRENVVYLHGQPSPVGHFLRVGTTGHRQLETLLGAGNTMPNRVVIEACAAGRQQELIQSLRDAGAELILDTSVAELSSLGRFEGAAREAPWANPAAGLIPDDMRANANLARVPDSRRVRHFLDHELAPTERAARNAAKLKVSDDGLSELLSRSSERLEKMHAVLEDLGRTVDGAPRAAAPERSRSALSAASLVRR